MINHNNHWTQDDSDAGSEKERVSDGNHTPAAEAIVTDDVSVFEETALDVGVLLRATQLSAGSPRLSISRMMLGDVMLATVNSNQDLAVNFQARPDTINFSIQAGVGGFMLEGKARKAHSLVMYSLPGAARWAAVLPKNEAPSRTNGAVHVSIPLSLVSQLRLPESSVGTGWCELELEPELSREFVAWAHQRLSVDVHNVTGAKDQLLWWLQRLLTPISGSQRPSAMHSPGHYSHIIGLVDGLVDAAPTWDPPSIVQLAQQLRISTRTLQRSFQRVYGVSVSQYLQHRRLEKARTLLLKDRRPICYSARRVGFDHASRFAAQYRRLYGQLPSESRRRA